MWQGMVPAMFQLHHDEVTSRQAPDPFYVSLSLFACLIPCARPCSSVLSSVLFLSPTALFWRVFTFTSVSYYSRE